MLILKPQNHKLKVVYSRNDDSINPYNNRTFNTIASSN